LVISYIPVSGAQEMNNLLEDTVERENRAGESTKWCDKYHDSGKHKGIVIIIIIEKVGREPHDLGPKRHYQGSKDTACIPDTGILENEAGMADEVKVRNFMFVSY
jgi:hypothetical protein